MASIRKIPGSSHQQNDRELAHGLYQEDRCEEALKLLKRYSLEEMDLPTRFLMGKIYLKLNCFLEAKLYLERVFSEDQKNKQALRLLIDTHNCLNEYQLVLFYLNHLFKLDGDVNQDIQNVLKLYRRLGFYDRAIELQETMDQNDFFHEDYLEEKILMALEIENRQLAQKIQKENKNLLRRRPVLQRAIRRLLRGTPFLGLRNRMYIHWGRILLGSMDDNGLDDDPIYQIFVFNLCSLYETFLRFIDLCSVNHIKFRGISTTGSDEDHIAIVLSQILSVPFLENSEQNLGSNLPILYLHSSWKSEFYDLEGVHFALSVHSNFLNEPLKLPDFIGVITTNEITNYKIFDTTIPENPQKLYTLMFEKRHISSMNFEARESMYGLQDLSFQKNCDIRISRLPSFHNVPRRKPWDYKYLRESLQSDGLLYSKSLLETHGQAQMPKIQVRELLNACKNWDYNSPETLRFCYKIQPDLTMNFILSDLSKTELSLQLLPNINHLDILPILKELMLQNDPMLLRSKTWTNLIFEPKFDFWLENQMQDGRHIEYLMDGFLQLTEFYSFKTIWLSIIAEKINSEKDWDSWSKIALMHMKHSPSANKLIGEILNDCTCFSRGIYQLMLELKVHPNQSQLNWISNSMEQKPNFCTQIIQEFELIEILETTLDAQKTKIQNALLKYSDLTKTTFKQVSEKIRDLIPITKINVQAELYGFLLNHAIDQYRILDQLFHNTELKLNMRPQLTKFFKDSEDISSERDLLFLMEQNEAGRIATAKLLVHQGDMEFYMYLVHRFNSHSNEFGLEIFKTLFECRSDYAIEMLIQHGMISKKINKENLLSILQYIINSQTRRDEWQTFLKNTSNSSLRTTLKCWLEQNFNQSPDFLIVYLNTFLEENFENTLDKFVDLKNYTEQQLQNIQRLNPSKTLAILNRLDSKSLTYYLLKLDWKKELN